MAVGTNGAEAAVSKVVIPPQLADKARVRTGEGDAAQASAGKRDPAKVAAARKAFGQEATLVGEIVWLMLQSPPHRNVFLSEMEWRVLPALQLRQCRVFKRDGMPFAFVSWAMVSEEIAGRLQAAPARIQSREWKCGERLMLIDVVAPFGGAEHLVQEIVKQNGKTPVPEAGKSTATASDGAVANG